MLRYARRYAFAIALAFARVLDLRAGVALVARFASFVQVGVFGLDDFRFGIEDLALIAERFRLVVFRLGVLVVALFGGRGLGVAFRLVGARAGAGCSLGGLRFGAFLCVCFGCHGVLEAALGRVRATWQPRQSVFRSPRVVKGTPEICWVFARTRPSHSLPRKKYGRLFSKSWL